MTTNDNARFDFSALDDLMSAVDHDYQSFEILGAQIPLQPITTLQAVRLVKRFPVLLDFFEPRVDPKSGKELPAHLQPTVMTVVINAGSDAVAAWCACAAGREGNADFEKAFASKPDKLTRPLFKYSVKITFGDGDIGSFFTQVMADLAEAGVLKSPPVSKAA